MIKRFKILSLFLLIVVSFAYAMKFYYKPIVIENISRYNEDRIAYIHVQQAISKNTDNSFCTLLIIKDKKIYLLQDGYDDPKIVAQKKLRFEMENKLYGDLWVNKINNKPDYVRITERRVEIMKNFSEEFVSKNFGTFFNNVRTALLKKHVEIFKKLMRNRKESGLIVNRTPLPVKIYLNAPTTETKYKTTVSGKTIDEKLYYAEDANGDGITETFIVHSSDGFHWGYKSGPNIIFIYKNTVDEIKNIIGDICKWAYYGTPEEEKEILQNFPKDSDIIDYFKLDTSKIQKQK